MTQKKTLILFFFILLSSGVTGNYQKKLDLGNNKRTIYAIPIAERVTIDGFNTEDFWEKAPAASNFFEFQPHNGATAGKKTEVRLAYDNYALYVFAHLFDNPDSISYRLSKRDQINNADLFGLVLDPFDDGLGGYGFFVTIAGVQLDCRLSDNEDFEWNSVWDSEVNITDNGWMVEIAIPYSAIRFPKKEIQTWGINFTRTIQRTREKHWWNFVDVNIPGICSQLGQLLGIVNIKPPLRLSLTPYISSYVEKYGPISGYSLKGGVDLKYGINESYTLDMMLIPDFGQVTGDREVLNLGPYETYYSENRDFFKEGVELFNRAELFHSRRIGGRPVNYLQVPLDSNEIITKNPGTTQIINATKITGKTTRGFSIGLLNAITSPSYAQITDTITRSEREWETQAATNQNVTVFEQTLPHNSYISVINTNLTRADGYFANASGIEMHLERGGSHGVSGHATYTYRDVPENPWGYLYRLTWSKTQGKFRYALTHRTESEFYNPNDMGFSYVGNKNMEHLFLGYYHSKPSRYVLNWRTTGSCSYNTLADYSKFKSVYFNVNGGLTFRNHLSMGGSLGLKPIPGYNYDEPRKPGYRLKTPATTSASVWVSSDYRKPIAIDISSSIWNSIADTPKGYSWALSPRLNISDNTLIIYRLNSSNEFDNYGFVSFSTNRDSVFFGQRNFKKLLNTVEVNYIINRKSSFSLLLDHNWSRVDYKNYHLLTPEGELQLLPENYLTATNINRNFFNLDLVYEWHFASGSVVSIVWKNALSSSNPNTDQSYLNNIKQMVEHNAQNSFSIRVIYYLDYLTLRNKTSPSSDSV